jgi:hypothetical protein
MDRIDSGSDFVPQPLEEKWSSVTTVLTMDLHSSRLPDPKNSAGLVQ